MCDKGNGAQASWCAGRFCIPELAQQVGEIHFGAKQVYGGEHLKRSELDRITQRLQDNVVEEIRAQYRTSMSIPCPDPCTCGGGSSASADSVSFHSPWMPMDVPEKVVHDRNHKIAVSFSGITAQMRVSAMLGICGQ